MLFLREELEEWIEHPTRLEGCILDCESGDAHKIACMYIYVYNER